MMDETAFDAFYAASYHKVVAQVYLTCGNLAEAQDCAQEAFVRAWDRRKSLESDRHPEAWVRTVAHRLSISRWRKMRRSLLLGDHTPEPVSDDPDVPQRVALAAALRELPEPTRHVMVLHYYVDLAVSDIATELGIPVGTVKARLSRGRTALAERLGVATAASASSP